MKVLDALEDRSGWYFKAKNVKAVSNTLADNPTRWGPEKITEELNRLRPDVNRREQILGEKEMSLCSQILSADTQQEDL